MRLPRRPRQLSRVTYDGAPPWRLRQSAAARKSTRVAGALSSPSRRRRRLPATRGWPPTNLCGPAVGQERRGGAPGHLAPPPLAREPPQRLPRGGQPGLWRGVCRNQGLSSGGGRGVRPPARHSHRPPLAGGLGGGLEVWQTAAVPWPVKRNWSLAGGPVSRGLWARRFCFLTELEPIGGSIASCRTKAPRMGLPSADVCAGRFTLAVRRSDVSGGSAPWLRQRCFSRS